ncbi:MAG: KilA-N domain-containing protein [Clostridia bacterium]|nr:KilA-N domain-containing protein [Clostridia bacterium]
MQIGIDVDGVLLDQNIKVNITNIDDNDYICISDFGKYKEGKSKADDIIRNWLRNRITLEFLGTWESIYNPNFNSVEFDGFRKSAGLHTFTLSVTEWCEKTNAIGIYSKRGKYGGTYAHKDIAFEFASAISPVFKLYLIKEFERLKEIENQNREWNVSMITGIIKNKVYTGDLIQQKRKRISFKNHKLIKTKEDELIITKNNHMDIISKEQFARVQDIIKHSVKVNSNNEYDIFSGYLKCAECDSNLTIRKSKEYTYYACSSHVRKRGCNNKHTIRKDILEEKVITEINNRQDTKIDKLNRKYIFDLINMIYLNQDGSIKIEFKRK